MARTNRANALDNRTARLKLPLQKRFYAGIGGGLALCYRRDGKGIGTWTARIGFHEYKTRLIGEADDFKDAIMGLREFLFDKVYRSSIAKSEEHKVVDMIKFLYEYFYAHKDKIPKEFLDMDSTLEQKVCDYISMMSDHFAVKTYEDITVPKSWSKY